MLLSYWVLLALMSLGKKSSKRRNLADITWAHGVNDKLFLKTSLSNDIDMLEADILMGRLSTGKERELPIMAHPPNDVSDLSLLEFVMIVNEFNRISPHKKGMKLDFKSLLAFEIAVKNDAFCKIISEADYPVWFNADILVGPLASPHVQPLDSLRFLKGAKLFPNVVLSLGWTTGFNSTAQAGYSYKHVEEMVELLNSNDIRQPVTFPMRAGLVAESKGPINTLMNNNTYTVTLWSHGTDVGFDVGKLNDVLTSLGKDRVYVDVPKSLRQQLVLINKNSTNIVN